MQSLFKWNFSLNIPGIMDAHIYGKQIGKLEKHFMVNKRNLFHLKIICFNQWYNYVLKILNVAGFAQWK